MQLSAAPAPAQTPGGHALRPEGLLTCHVVTDLAETENLRPAWTALLERSRHNELTQSPDWLLTWWRVYGPLQGRQLRLVQFSDGCRLVGLAPLLRRRCWYHGLLPFRRLELVGSGEPEGHGIYSNHLGVLAESGAETAVARALVAALIDGRLGSWDDLVLPMMDGDTAMPALLAAAFQEAGINADVVEMARAPYLRLPGSWEEYLRGLSRAHRRHVTRSLHRFEQWADGQARLERATDRCTLARGEQILIDLHHARWQADRRPGVFRSPLHVRFHQTIMRQLLDRSALELTWLTVNGRPVAGLYGMTWAGKVYAYQIGRSLDVPSDIRPGGVILAYAVRTAIEAGRREFDLLADQAPYKMQLGAVARSLVLLRAVRPTFRETLRRWVEGGVNGARFVGRKVRRWLARTGNRQENGDQGPAQPEKT